jgi:translation initiation factor 2-alpha kinase 3
MSSALRPDALQNGPGSGSTVDSGAPGSADSSVDESIEVSREHSTNMSGNGNFAKSTVSPSTRRVVPGVAGPLTRLATSSPQLPNLEPQQHSALFYLSLIEGRCRTQAAYLLNEGRHPTDQLAEDHDDVCALARSFFAELSKELHKAGILPDDFAGQDLEDLRGKYLNTFDTALHNIATKTTRIISDPSTTGSSLIPDVFALTKHPYSAMEKIVKRNSSPGGQQALLSSLFLKESRGEQLAASIFQTQYGPKSLLGKGGFGQVFRARNLIDDREYAVKRIVIRGKKVNLAGNKGQQQALLMEARSLSKLNHQNIVRYYGAWVETCPAGTRLDGDLSAEFS